MKRKTKRAAGILLIAASIGLPSASALAWDGIKTAKLTGLHVVADGQNFGFRIYLDGTPLCGTDANWAYLNKDADNYDAMVSLLTSAYFSGKQVTVYTDKMGSYCKIGYVAL